MPIRATPQTGRVLGFGNTGQLFTADESTERTDDGMQWFDGTDLATGVLGWVSMSYLDKDC